MPRCISATGSWTSAVAPTTRCARPRRSGKQNILEGSRASFGTSKETELKLTNVARASLEELLADYRRLPPHRTAAPDRAQGVAAKPSTSARLGAHASPLSPTSCYRPLHRDPSRAEIVANIALSLIHQANDLLGPANPPARTGFPQSTAVMRERMTRARLAARARQQHPPS